MAARPSVAAHLIPPELTSPEPLLVGDSDTMRAVRLRALRVAACDAKVLITGESGAGKDLVARFIHAHSARATRPFVPINCAGVAETLLESELFGHVRGSFTGAYRDKIGKLQHADGGTIFLDEIGEMSLRMQALLLRFLENGEIHPVGSDRICRVVNVRVVSATNRDLLALVGERAFREDLLFRINVLPLRMPALRERRDDIRALVAHFLSRQRRRLTLTEETYQVLERYSWPGNIRELMNVVEQLIFLTAADVVTVDDLPAQLRISVAPPRDQVERRRGIADDLYEGLVSGRYAFWDHVYTRFLSRDLTRNDLRLVIRKGLEAAEGSYADLLAHFGMRPTDYKRLSNFLAAHGASVDYRPYRRSPQTVGSRALGMPRRPPTSARQP